MCWLLKCASHLVFRIFQLRGDTYINRDMKWDFRDIGGRCVLISNDHTFFVTTFSIAKVLSVSLSNVLEHFTRNCFIRE